MTPNLLTSLFERPWLRRSVLTIAAVAIIIALYYGEENWRGKRAWEKYKRERVALGENFGRMSLALPKVPDDQNFYKTPLLEANGYRNSTNRPSPQCRWLFDSTAFKGAIGSQSEGKRSKLSAYHDYLRKQANYNAPANRLDVAADIVRVFNENSDINEIRAASLRPFSQCDYVSDALDAPIPNFIEIRGFVQGFALLLKAELDLGDSENAFRDMGVILKFADAMRGNPKMVGSMLRVAVVGLYTQTFWEGWADKRWTDKQYEAFQKNFESFNLIVDYNRGLEGERAGVRMFVEEIPSLPASFAIKAAPRGWYYQNLLFYHRVMEETRKGYDILEKTYDPKQADRAFKRIVKLCYNPGPLPNPFKVLAQLMVPNFGKAGNACAQAQAFADEAAIVCALERFFHAKGYYPSDLGELSPNYMSKVPHDVIGGQPLCYRSSAKGFQLYSIGLNRTDDGGIAGETSGDWVWISPADSK